MIKNGTHTTFFEIPYFKPSFQISKCTTEQQKFLTMFKFQHSQSTQKEFEQKAELLLKYPHILLNGPRHI